jgi:Spy/CpxP family protein refolding chaperone
MKRMTLLIGAALPLVAVGTAVALAWNGAHHHHEFFRKQITQRIDDALDAARVTPEQRGAIHAARDRAFTALHERPGGRRGDLETALRLFEADKIDAAQVQALRARHEAEHQRATDAVIAAVTESHGVLAPSQRQAVADYLRAHRPEHHEHHGFMQKMVSHRVEQALDAVDATPAQRTAIHAAVEHVFTTVAESFSDHAAALDRALALFAQEKVSDGQIAALRSEHEAKARAVGDAVVQALYDVHDALTAPQRRQAVAWVRAQLHEHFDEPGEVAAPPAESTGR